MARDFFIGSPIFVGFQGFFREWQHPD